MAVVVLLLGTVIIMAACPFPMIACPRKTRTFMQFSFQAARQFNLIQRFKEAWQIAFTVSLVALGTTFTGCGNNGGPEKARKADAFPPPSDQLPASNNQPEKQILRTVPGLGLELVKIEPGTFMMGSPGHNSDEGPPTRVTISKGFSMSKYEVTQGQYEAVMGANPSRFKGNLNLPVENVSWVDATNFCAKLTEQEQQAGRLPEGYMYRLPTEAECEYACRAGTTTRFSYGDDPEHVELGEYAWYDENSGGKTHPVGQKKPNPWGLHDMHGNVWEWCLDWYTLSLPGGSVTDPKGPSSGSSRVLRGGFWYSYAGYCRSANRDYFRPDYTDDGLYGFRPVLAPGQPGQ